MSNYHERQLERIIELRRSGSFLLQIRNDLGDRTHQLNITKNQVIQIKKILSGK